MNNQVNDKVAAIVKAVKEAKKNASIPFDIWIQSYNPGKFDKQRNQFIAFLKPETTKIDAGVDLDAILSLVFKSLERFDVNTGAIKIMNSKYLEEKKIIDQHYGVINRLSREGESALSEQARVKMKETFATEIANGATIIGGHQFLNLFNTFTAFTLNIISDNIGTVKLAGGSYCLKLSIESKVYLILSPFHPYQLEHFYVNNQVLVVMELESDTNWKSLREDLLGSTNPEKAREGSLRAIILSNKDQLGLIQVDSGNNGFHISAGPLEGMVEIIRFLGDPNAEDAYKDTSFGELLISQGLTDADIEKLSNNIALTDKRVPAFDMTEEMNALQAVEILKLAYKRI